jgi:YVTN family beta-propeller protein
MNPRVRGAVLLALPLLGAASLLRTAPGAPAPAEKDRSPLGLVLSRDGRWAVTANSTSDTVSLVDLQARKRIAEVPAGRRPFGIALSADGKRAAVTNFSADSVTLFEVDPKGLKQLRTFPVGDEPRGVAFSGDGRRLFVALGGENTVAVADPAAGKVLSRVAVGQEPWHLVLTPDGKRLAVGNTRSQDVSVLDTAALKVLQTVRLKGRNVRGMSVSPDGAWAYVPHIAERGFSTIEANIDRGWVTASRFSRVPLLEEGPREAISLDERGRAVGDVEAAAVSPDGNTFALAAGGTHELLLLRLPLPFVAYGGPDDHIDPQLLVDARRFRRVALGGRPVAAQFTPDGKQVVVANYLRNALQIVEVESGQAVASIPLGGPATPTLARKGETLFLDATRSFNQWYSCATCHPEGHTNGGNFDTKNDGRYGNLKKTLSLRGVTETGPYTWHGWQEDLRESVHNSFVHSMQGPEPAAADLDAVVAYLGTLEVPPSPHRNADGSLPAAAKRGHEVFAAKLCGSCHGGPNFTSKGAFSVGLEDPEDMYKGYNPPSLRNLYNRAPYLHDGRARTLEEVLTRWHRPSQLNGKADLTPEELKDLVAYLRAL